MYSGLPGNSDTGSEDPGQTGAFTTVPESGVISIIFLKMYYMTDVLYDIHYHVKVQCCHKKVRSIKLWNQYSFDPDHG